jgi:hypothetical protein
MIHPPVLVSERGSVPDAPHGSPPKIALCLSKQLKSAPPDKKPETKAFSSITPETLVSRAASTLFALENVTTAKPILAAKIGVKSTLTKPRTPEVPKSFDFKPSFTKQRLNG